MISGTNLSDFWDQNKNAVIQNASRLMRLRDDERAKEILSIRHEVTRQVNALSDEQMLKLAVTLVDDIYQHVNDEVIVGPIVFAYLDACGAALIQLLKARGYVVHYIVENQFLSTEFLFLGPFDIFKKFFNAIGLVYICPQLLGWQLMSADGINEEQYSEQFAQYADEARFLSSRLVEKCRQEDRHFIYLETDFREGCLDRVMDLQGAANVLRVFRNDAPVPDSSVDVIFPKK